MHAQAIWVASHHVLSRFSERGEGPSKRAQTDQMQKDMYFHHDDFEIAACARYAMDMG
jgi:hypothetical protein